MPFEWYFDNVKKPNLLYSDRSSSSLSPSLYSLRTLSFSTNAVVASLFPLTSTPSATNADVNTVLWRRRTGRQSPPASNNQSTPPSHICSKKSGRSGFYELRERERDCAERGSRIPPYRARMMSHQFSAYGAPLLGTSELNGQQILPSGEPSMETGTSPSANGEEKDINLESKSNETAEQDTDMPLEGASNGEDIIMEVVDDGKVDMVPENNSNEQSLEERTA